MELSDEAGAQNDAASFSAAKFDQRFEYYLSRKQFPSILFANHLNGEQFSEIRDSFGR